MNAETLPLVAKDPCDATIVICTYNRVRTLPLTLTALNALRGPYTFEVIVVNGPSTDGTDELLGGYEGIRVFRNPEANLSISRNIGIANAVGRYVAFIDDDAVPEPDWLSLMIDHLDANAGLSALGGFIRDANGISFQAKYVYCDSFGRGYPCDDAEYATYISRETPLFMSLTGTNVVFRRRDLLKVGGFDETFAYFLDETDVNKRMVDQGMQIDMLPAAEIHHKYAPSHLRTERKVTTNMYPIARSVAYFTLTHGVPERGWGEVSQRLRDYYAEEFRWKSDTVSAGHLKPVEFDRCMEQTYRGIIEGIDTFFDRPVNAAATRVDRHQAETPPVLRKMRDPDDTLRLCLFSQDHGHPSPAGIGRWTSLVARGMADRGHEVTVIGQLQDSASQEYADFTADGYWSHNLKRKSAQAHADVDCLGLPSGLAAQACQRKAEFDRIMPRRRFQLASSPIWDVEGAAVIAAARVPTVLSLHTCAGLMLASKPEWMQNEQYYRNHVLKVISAEIHALKRTNMILANSRAIIRDISDVYGLDLFEKRHEVVPHGIDDIDRPEGLLEARVGADQPPRILFLGRLERRKGVSDLVQVAERLLQGRPDLRLDIVGGEVDAEHRAMVDKLAGAYPRNVRYHGFLGDREIDALMRRADIFFAPSHYESFGLIYVEAMRYSVPCVGYATGGVPEVVTDGVDGILAPLGDTKELYTALEHLLDNKDKRLALSKGARNTFVDRLHYAAMCERLERVYRHVAAAKNLPE